MAMSKTPSNDKLVTKEFKERHRRHRERNLIAKHLREQRDGIYRLRVVKPKTDYVRQKISVKDININEYDSEQD